MKKILILFGIIVLLLSCVDENVYHPQVLMSETDLEILTRAETFINECKGTVVLPMNRNNSKFYSRVTSNSDKIEIDWGNSKIYRLDDGRIILMSPLKSEKEMLSKVKCIDGLEHDFLFSKTYSRLVIIMNKDEIWAKLFTYIPDGCYEMDDINMISCFVEHTNFSGLLLTSTIGGDVKKGYRYTNGCLVSKYSIKEKNHITADENIFEKGKSKKQLQIHFFSRQFVSRTIYNLDSESLICSLCGDNALKCECVIIEEDPIYCEGCNMLKGECVCDYFKCSECGQDPCSCIYDDWDNDDNIGDEGGNNDEEKDDKENGGGTASSEANVGPYEYTKNDNMAVPDIPQTMPIQVPNTCVTAIMEFVTQIYGPYINEGEFWTYYSLECEDEWIPCVGFNLQFLDKVVNHFFNTSEFIDYESAIDSDYVIMTDIDGIGNDRHNVLIVGYTNDSQYIYMDPEKGYLCKGDESMFGETYNIVITNVKK